MKKEAIELKNVERKRCVLNSFHKEPTGGGLKEGAGNLINRKRDGVALGHG